MCSGRQISQKSRAERGEVDRAAHGARAPAFAHRLHDLGLGLEHLVVQRVGQRLAREPDQAQAVQVVHVGRHPVAVARPRFGIDHRQAGRGQLGAGRQLAPGAHVHRCLRALDRQQPQDPPLVGRQLAQDALVGRMGVLVLAHVGRPAQQLGAPVAQRRDFGLRHVGLGARGRPPFPSSSSSSSTPNTSRAYARMLAPASANRSVTGSPDTAARTSRSPARMVTVNVQPVLRHHAPAAIRTSPGTATSRLPAPLASVSRAAIVTPRRSPGAAGRPRSRAPRRAGTAATRLPSSPSAASRRSRGRTSRACARRSAS